MATKTITDKDGDQLDISGMRDGLYLTAAQPRVGRECTAGPFTREQIVKALDEVDPDLASPDYADGGMAAAVVEKEAERVELADDPDYWHAKFCEARQERDELRQTRRRLLGKVDQLEVKLRDIEGPEPRPLTPDAITDSHVLSARLKANALGWFGRFNAPAEEWRQVLAAALTEPPSRPEGAEEIEVALYSALPSARLDEDEIKDLADALAGHLAGEGE